MKKVAIIGGGIAGLAAAESLVRSRFTVTVVEARDRFGGRIHTIDVAEFPVDLGAEFIHGRDPALWRLIASATLATHAVPGQQLRVEKDGSLRPHDFWAEFSTVAEQIDCEAGDESFAHFIAHAKAPSETKKQAYDFVEGFNAASADRISAQSIAVAERSSAAIDGENQFRVHHGYGALISWLVTLLQHRGARLRLETEVRKITWKPGAVELLLHGKEGDEFLEADAAILTLPLGVLKAAAVQFEPPLPQAKLEAIQNLAFGAVMKMNLVFRERFWPEENLGFIHALDEEIPTWWSDPRAHSLIGWAGGPKAERFADLTDRQVIDRATEILARIFQTKPERVRSALLHAHRYNWTKDPFSRGAYSFIPVGMLGSPEDLGKSLDEIGRASCRERV